MTNIQVIDPRNIAVVDNPTRGPEPGWNTTGTGQVDLTVSEATNLADKPFVVYHPDFLKVIGDNPQLKVVAKEDSFPFAHEAGVWIPSTREVFFTSNQYKSNPNQKRKQISICKIKIPENPEDGPYKWGIVKPTPDIPGGNGGTSYNGGALICQQGVGDVSGALVFLEAKPPYKSSVVLNNFHGRPFNAPNDVVVLPLDGSIWFTDPDYAEIQGLRDVKKLPNQVYSYSPKTGTLRVVVDGISNPNGIAFSHDYKTLYVTQTRAFDGIGGVLDDAEGTIYAFDLIQSPGSSNPDRPYVAVNKRLFAFADTAAPDGIKVDTYGNVYSGCLDGIHVWNPDGVLIGKILVPNGIANFVFTDPGRILLFNENRILEASIAAKGALETL